MHTVIDLASRSFVRRMARCSNSRDAWERLILLSGASGV